MKKKRNLRIKTVMSWENEYKGKFLRAIALCHSSGWFDVAINCMRDGSMGEPDGNGVYDRKWWSDEACSCSGDRDLRPATDDEVALYRKYCPEEFESRTWEDGWSRVRVLGVCSDCYGTHVIDEPLPPVWWKRLWNRLRNHHDQYPF